jgi:hypothetical protein
MIKFFVSQAMNKAPAVTVPPFKPLPPVNEGHRNVSRPSRLASGNGVGVPSVVAVPVPPFQALPSSISRVSTGPATVGVKVVRAPVAFRNSLEMATNHFQVRLQDDVDNISVTLEPILLRENAYLI